MAKVIFILTCLATLFVPMVTSREAAVLSTVRVQEFPKEFEGRPLREVGLTEREKYFLNGFPGQIGRFTDGHREIIIRRVEEATRRLHPASDCFRAIGYTVTPLPLKVDDQGKRWSGFTAVKAEESLRVHERIDDARGREWTDVSSWYWSVWGEGKGEWWAWTVAERNDGAPGG